MNKERMFKVIEVVCFGIVPFLVKQLKKFVEKNAGTMEAVA